MLLSPARRDGRVTGVEIEATSVPLNLSFIPDETTFDEGRKRDEATSAAPPAQGRALRRAPADEGEVHIRR